MCPTGAADFAAKSLRDKLRDKRGMQNLLGQVVADNIVFTPFFFMPYVAFRCARGST